MNRIKKLMSHLLVFTLLITLATPTAVKAEETGVYTIIHTNDMHGRMDTNKLAKLKSFKEETKPLLMLDGGDAMQGLPLSNLSKGADMSKVMNAIGYDAMAVGNHEFDFGQDVALGNVDGFGSVLEFPLLSSNTYNEDGQQIFDPSVVLGDGSVKTAQSKLVENEGLTIPIVGATTPETITKTHPDNIKGLRWEDPVPAVTRELLKYKDLNPEFYVVVTHLGTDSETQETWRSDYLAKQLSLQDETKDMRIVIIDGHSHSAEHRKYDNGVETNLRSDGSPANAPGNVLLVQTGEHLNNVGVVTVNLNDWNQTDAELLSFDKVIDSYDPDPVVLQLLEEARENFKEYGSRVLIPDNTVHFNGVRDAVRTRETNLGNAIADALVWYANATGSPADLAVVNGGGIRADILPGDVTLGDVIATIPFGNIYALIDVSGQDIIDMFEYSIRTPIQMNDDGSYKLDNNGLLQITANGGFLHTSESVILTYDPLRESGARIVELLINGEPVDPNASYKLATNDFLAVGGDGYTMLGGPRTEGPSLDVVFADYLNEVKDDLSMYADDTVQTRIRKTEFSVEEDVVVDALRALIEKSGDYSRVNYTEESYEVFMNAFDEAKQLLDIIDDARARTVITQADVDTALTNLQTAIDGLVEVKKPDALNITKLEALVNGKENYKKESYTEASFKVYEASISKGSELLKQIGLDESITQSQVDQAVKDIENAIAALVKVTKEEGKLPGTGMSPESIAIVPIGLIVGGAALAFIAKRKKDE